MSMKVMGRSSLLLALVISPLATSIHVAETSASSLSIRGQIAGNAHLENLRAKTIDAMYSNTMQNIHDFETGKLKRQDWNDVDSHQVVKDAVEYLVQKRANVSGDFAGGKAAASTANPGKVGCASACITAGVINGLLLIANAAGYQCPILILPLWWTVGIVAMMEDQKLSFPESVMVLAEHMTSVGYGSPGHAMPKTRGLKILHSLTGLVAISTISGPNMDVMAAAVDKLFFSGKTTNSKKGDMVQKMIPLAASIWFSGLGFAKDLQHMSSGTYGNYADAFFDAIYMTVFTMTTIGYGDINPGTPFGETLSAPWMWFIIKMYERAWMSDDELKEAKERLASTPVPMEAKDDDSKDKDSKWGARWDVATCFTEGAFKGGHFSNIVRDRNELSEEASTKGNDGNDGEHQGEEVVTKGEETAQEEVVTSKSKKSSPVEKEATQVEGTQVLLPRQQE